MKLALVLALAITFLSPAAGPVSSIKSDNKALAQHFRSVARKIDSKEYYILGHVFKGLRQVPYSLEFSHELYRLHREDRLKTLDDYSLLFKGVALGLEIEK